MKSDKNIREGYKRTAVGVIPEEWEEVKIGKLGETFNGLTGKTKKDFGEGKPYVTYLNTFRQNCIDENTSFDYVKINDNENQSTLKYGDLIFTTSSETPNEVGMSSVVLFHPKDSLYLNSFCFGLRLENFETLHPSFATFMLRGNDFRREMYKLAQGSTRFNLSKASFKKITVKLPPIEEQTAIAHILTTWDSGIEKLTQLIAAKREQKKGLMQQLLTGKKRLDGFVGEWKEVKLGDLSFRKTSSLKSSDLIENSGKYGVYGATGFITKVDFYDEKEPYIAIVKDGSGVGNMYLLEGESSVIGTMDKIFPRDSNLIFLYNRMKGFNFGKYKVGGAIPHIYYKDYSKEIISIPSLAEQTAIANVLSTADQEISLLEAKLAAMKEEKKGLMQVLLTGKKRLIDS